MAFELQTRPVPDGLAAIGASVELRELPYGKMRAAMVAAEKASESADRLLSASLHVDGAPIGFDALQALPGRFAGAISKALEQCLEMHGLSRAEAPEPPKA